MLLRILSRIKAEPWAITQAYMDTILEIAQRENLNPEAVAAKLGQPLENTYSVDIRDGVAILPVNGPLFRYANLFNMISGGTSYDLLARDFTAALENPDVRSILLEVDSPGGEANGVSEFADMIFAARGRKPIVAYVGGSAASAAYWIASAADEIVMADTAEVGSIGTVVGVQDTRERDAKNGVKRYEIVSSQSPYKRLDLDTEEGRSRLLARVDALSDVFIDKVARFRGVDTATVLSDFGQGDVIIASAAVRAGMADSIGTFEGTLARLAGPTGSAGIGTAAAGGKQTEDGNMPHYLTTTAPAAGEDQRQMEATAENVARLCPDVAKALREEGAAAKAAELQEQIDAAGDSAEQYAGAERERIQAILGCDEAKGRESLAEHLAFNDDIGVEKAKAYLAAAPMAGQGSKEDPLTAAMRSEQEPVVGADGGQDDDEVATAVARSQQLGKELGIE